MENLSVTHPFTEFMDILPKELTLILQSFEKQDLNFEKLF